MRDKLNPSRLTTYYLCKSKRNSILLFLFAHQEEVIDYDFGDVFLLPVFVGVGAVGELAFDSDLRAFVGVLGQDFRLLAPDDQVVPGGFGDLFPFLVFVGLVGGEGSMSEDFAGFEGFDFDFGAEAADELNFVS